MRKKFNSQMNLFSTVARNKIAQELRQISAVLDATPQVMDLVYQDLVRSCRPTTGREGMSAEQVLRCAILKQYRQLTYEELAFHLEDSDSFRGFSRLEMGQYPSTLEQCLVDMVPPLPVLLFFQRCSWGNTHCQRHLVRAIGYLQLFPAPHRPNTTTARLTLRAERAVRIFRHLLHDALLVRNRFLITPPSPLLQENPQDPRPSPPRRGSKGGVPLLLSRKILNSRLK